MSPTNAQEDIQPLTQRVGDLNRYLIDLKGYLVVSDALSKNEVDSLNQVIDEQLLPPPTTYNRFGTAPLGSGFLGWHPAFVALIDHASVIDLLQFLLGPSFTLRAIYGIYEERFAGKPIGGRLSSNSIPGAETELSCTVVWNLTDTGPGIGGLCCVDGSHHLRRDLPVSIQAEAHMSPLVVTPDASSGTAIIYASRLVHGNGSWLGPHQRRSLFFEYATTHEGDPQQAIDVPSFPLSRRQHAILGHSNK